MTLPEKYRGRKLLFMGIRQWDAVMSDFTPPEGSKIRPCFACGESTWVQGSFLKLLRQGGEGCVVCYRCARRAGLGHDPRDAHEIVPEAMEEFERWVRTKRQ